MAQRNKSLPSHQRDWTSNPAIRNPRSVFDLGYPVKTTLDSGYLVPLKPLEILPGDTIRCRFNAIIRMATPIHPVMDNIKATIHFWGCPDRQLWDNWKFFMGEQVNPSDSTDYLIPQLPISGTLGDDRDYVPDYMGVPLSYFTGTVNVNALPFRMYNRVYNEHYRDANLQDSIPQSTDDGPDNRADYRLRRRGKRHDYLTSALPFQQRGEPVPIAVGGLSPVIASGSGLGSSDVIVGASDNSAGWYLDKSQAGNNVKFPASSTPGNYSALNLFADLGASSGTTITDLRQSIAIQQILERDARGGVRYPEQLVSRFGVTDPQLLVLQRPEYLGGQTIDINISPVPQTSGTPDQQAGTVQGNLAAVATAMFNGNAGFTKSFTEHGWVLPIISIQADLTYQQGLERFWSRRERFDYFTPELAHVSEQPIYSREIFCTGAADDALVWGYNGAYDDYRTSMPLISGRFKSTPVTGATLDPWHVTPEFASRPALNDSFIQDNPPIDRVVAVKTEPQFIMDGYMSIKAARILPLTGVPGLYRI